MEGIPALDANNWPSIFDPMCQFEGRRGTPSEIAVEEAISLWDEAPELEDRVRLKSVLRGQESQEYFPWQAVHRFSSTERKAHLVVDGTYLRVVGRINEKDGITFLPVFQPITRGFVFTPTAIPQVKGNYAVESDDYRTVEMVICVKTGHLIAINNPKEILEIDSVTRAMLVSRDADLRWLRNQIFDLQTNEGRVGSLIRNLAGFKETTKFDEDSVVFKYPFSQNALADCLGLSDNTLRPHLKTRSFEWTGGKLLMSPDFVELAKTRMLGS